MSQVVTRKRLTPGSLRGHEAARTVLLRMALDHGRAERVRQLKLDRPDLTWSYIADKVGVTERSAIDWQKTGGISHSNCKKLATVFGVDPDWLWSGADRGETPDLMESLRGDAPQLDRIEGILEQILSRVAALELAAGLEEEADRRSEQPAPSAAKPTRKSRSRRAS